MVDDLKKLSTLSKWAVWESVRTWSGHEKQVWSSLRYVYSSCPRRQGCTHAWSLWVDYNCVKSTLRSPHISTIQLCNSFYVSIIGIRGTIISGEVCVYAQNLFEQLFTMWIEEENDFRQRMAQPPWGLPESRLELSMPLTPIEMNSSDISRAPKCSVNSQCSWIRQKSSEFNIVDT